MIKTLDRYLLKNFLLNYALSLFVLISLYVVLDLFVNFDEFTEEGKPIVTVIGNIADYYFYNLPLYFSQLSGIITLFAACATLARLQRHNEVTAILASGTSLYRLAIPIIFAGLVMNMLLLFDHEKVLPQVAHKLARARDDVKGEHVYDVWFVKDGEGRLLSAQRFSPKEKKIGGLIVMEHSTAPSDHGQMKAIITADIAQWDEQRHGWNLISRGERTAWLSDSDEDLGAEDSLIPTNYPFYKSELTPEDLLLRKSAQWLSLLSLDQLGQLKDHGDVDPIRVAQVRAARLTMPISNMILLLLGISFFMNRLPESVLTQGAKALATCAIAFLATFAGQQLVGSAGWIPLALPYWLPIFIFGPIAALLFDNVKT